MDIKPLKTVRFTKLVEESGEPVPVTLWTEPEEDRDFAKAMREGRVLTVVQRNVGARADYGVVASGSTERVVVDAAASDILRESLRSQRSGQEPFFDRGPGYAHLSGGAASAEVDWL